MTDAAHAALASGFARNRAELVTYATRMVTRHDVAEELVQQAALRMLETAHAPSDPDLLRPWLFRVLTNLCIDHLRRHATRRERPLESARERVLSDAALIAEARSLVAAPELRAVAREHLIACFICVLRHVPSQQAAALLLKDVYGFSVSEAAELLGATFAQIKNWLQSARATLDEQYARDCALVKEGAPCSQCLELDAFFQAGRGNPLAETRKDTRARLRILRDDREETLGPWHRKLLAVVDDILR